MDTYQTYKDSGIIWVGQTPQHWSEQKIKFLFKEKKSTPNLSLNCGSISFGRVVFKDDDSIPSSRKETYQEVLDGEFLINPLNLNYDLKSLRIARSDKNVVVSPGYMILQLQRQSDPKFFEFLLHVFDTEHMKSLGSGVRQTISFNHLKTERLPLPPIDEQRKIGQYLDRKTTLLDSLIEKTVRKIELLKEKRTSLINEVVTKGLNSDVEMKDSGVEWIGEIPSHWKGYRLRHLGGLYGGLTGKSGNDFKQDDHPMNRPYIPYTNIFRNTYISKEHVDYVVLEEGEKQNRVQQYDLFFLMSSENYDDLGKPCVLVDHVEELYLNSFCKGFRVRRKIVNPLFLNYQLLGNTHRKLVSIEGKGFTRINLRQDRLIDTPMVIPPLHEQEQIVEYLDEQTSIIDSTITTEEKRIELLKEYRQSMISEVVTGKVKVTRDE